MSNAYGPVIRMLRSQRGWKQQELAELVKLDQSIISRIEKGQRPLKEEELAQIAAAFGVEVAEMDAQREALGRRRTVGGPGIPVINRAPAGIVVDYEEYGVDSGQGFEYVDGLGVSDSLAFAVIVVGNSMEPALHPGDYVVFSPQDPEEPRPDQAPLKPGGIVFVRFAVESAQDGGCTIARFYSETDGRVRLQKDNLKYPPIFCHRQDIRQLAVAVQKRESL